MANAIWRVSVSRGVGMDDPVKLAHQHSSGHSQELAKSALCGCFYCMEVFAPSDINDWCDDGDTALCPKCGGDSVIGDASNFPVTSPEFLAKMKRYWF
jgi:hypothetical protein